MMPPAGCKTASWFVYHQEAPASRMGYTPKAGERVRTNHGWPGEVTWWEGTETAVEMQRVQVKVVLIYNK